MPHFALANKLYRGRLPKEFCDLTWIEERVCAIYSNTAVITRLYQSSDPSQPTVFHVNTFAHEMNVSSTAAVLPRSPPDVNGLLSVVFIGRSKCKSKVWDFLQWLKTHNRLYKDILLDERTMDLYPDVEGWDSNSSSSVLGNRRFEVFSLFFLLLLPLVLILL